MITTINENITLWSESNPIELSSRLRFNKERIAIRDRWFDVLTPSEVVRKRNGDGYYRVIYIQIDWESGQYYIGKANRPTWRELNRYQGSGLRFVNKLKSENYQFVRYYIATCGSAEETERLEASIVDEVLLADEKCLNLVAGGAGTSKHSSSEERIEKIRAYLKQHPEQFRPMLEASKLLFRSGDSADLRARNQRIKEVMNTEPYREMSRERLKKWRTENPGDYAEARQKGADRVRRPESQAKRKAGLEKWIKSNPQEYKAWEERRIRACKSQIAREKHKTSQKEWREKYPEQAKENDQKRAQAAAQRTSKEVCMVDLQSGMAIKVFPSLHAAAKWLVENGKAKNMNCVSSISSVCLRKPCTTGYGHRKKAFGYDWRFASEIRS